jgi:hypothetical protein
MKTTRNHGHSPDKQITSVCLKRTLMARLAAIAAAENRSRNSQIEHFLELAVGWWDGQRAMTARAGGHTAVGNVVGGDFRQQ